MNRQQKELRRSAAKAFIESLDQLDDVFDKSDRSPPSPSGSSVRSGRSPKQALDISTPEEIPDFEEALEGSE